MNFNLLFASSVYYITSLLYFNRDGFLSRLFSIQSFS